MDTEANHQMRLHQYAFEKVAAGTKVIEIRLYDEKRRSLKAGDEIEFISRTDPTRTIRAVVEGLTVFPTFKELFAAYPPEEYGGTSQDKFEQMYQHYAPEDEAKYGVLAIRIRLLPRGLTSGYSMVIPHHPEV
jgi:ASC-1-like (ASCH) protein